MATVRKLSIWKWLGIALGSVAIIVLSAVVLVYVLIGRDLQRTFDMRAAKLDLPVDEASLMEGQRLAKLRGCADGCHGEAAAGQVFFELPDGTTVVAPDLAGAAQRYSPEEFDQIMRRGIRPDGTSVLLVMPSNMFHWLTDEDAGKIIAFFRSQTPSRGDLPGSHFGPLGRLLLFVFKQETGTILAAKQIEIESGVGDQRIDQSTDQGKYLAVTNCSECHGADLRGSPDGLTPSLAVVAAYTPESFANLMSTGKPLGKRQLNLMARVALERFVHFTEDEVTALHSYLKTLIQP